MATDAEPESQPAARWSPWAIAAAVLLALLFGLILIAAVRGCFSFDPQEAARQEADRKKKEDDQKKRKEEITPGPLVMLPSEPKSPGQYVKPGHWVTSSQRFTANYRDFVGDSRTAVVNRDSVPYPVNATPYNLRTSRPVALSKAQPKNIENTFFVPQTTEGAYYASELIERGLGLGISIPPLQLSRMPSFQYHFVILAKEPSRYTFIKTLDSVSVPYGGVGDFETRNDQLHYRVSQLDVRRTVPLPDNPLTWTSIAYILWDEVDPHLFTLAQQKALVDWLHWGGQLIVNGPDSMDLLKDSFLDPYLPARNAGARSITAKELAELNENWTISTPRVPGVPLRPTAPWSGIKLEIPAELKDLVQPLVGAGESALLVERPVGRGRIVVSAMQLSERDLINWRSGFESLFNACVLRRLPRVYREGSAGPVLDWVDDPTRELRLDAARTTTLKYFARDLGINTAWQFQEVQDEFQQFGPTGQPQKVREYRPNAEVGGLGAWNDFSATANAARDALRSAAGVEVPGSSFVVVCLAVYLTVLVPLNWLIFHALGRVEWAWIAAPIIAIAGTWVVVQQARLDIGFVRAHTEITVLEQQPEHPRALASRYSALYTSLSTTYDFEYSNLTTVAAPFPVAENDPLLSRMSRTPLDFQRQETVRLTGLPVASASTNFVHSEQMFPLNGPIRIGTAKAGGSEQIENRSQFRLQSVAVIERPDNDKNGDKLRGMWIGELLPGQSVAKPRTMLDMRDSKAPFADDRRDEERRQSRLRLDLEPLFRLATAGANMEPGETRLVARVDEVLPGQTITPEASQVRGAMLVVVHLRYGPKAPPARDANTRQEVKAAANAEIDFDATPAEQEPNGI